MAGETEPNDRESKNSRKSPRFSVGVTRVSHQVERDARRKTAAIENEPQDQQTAPRSGDGIESNDVKKSARDSENKQEGTTLMLG